LGPLHLDFAFCLAVLFYRALPPEWRLYREVYDHVVSRSLASRPEGVSPWGGEIACEDRATDTSMPGYHDARICTLPGTDTLDSAKTALFSGSSSLN
jgi:hypothetical protein